MHIVVNYFEMQSVYSLCKGHFSRYIYINDKDNESQCMIP